jgi:O-antigen/teichoic acid export membrane protein
MLALIRHLLDTLIPKKSSARHVGILASGTAIAQAIPIASSPILTRLYAPSDFGLSALYLACVSVLAVIATARYELAITLPESDEDAGLLVTFTIKLCLLISGFLYIPIAFFGEKIAIQLGSEELAPWLFLLPISIIATGFFNIFQFWLNRASQYRKMATNRILNAALTTTSNSIFGFAQLQGGLVLGGAIGQVSAAIMAVRAALNVKDRPFSIQHSQAKQLAIAKRYISHPKHIAPAQLIGVVAQQIPIFMVSNVFSLAIAGFFSLAYRLVSLPSGIVAGAIGDVYRQKIAVAYNERGEFRREFLATLKMTSLIAAPPFSILYFIAPELFAFVFGEKWRIAGEYAQILVVASFFQFIFTPIDKGAVVVGATRYIFGWHVTRLLAFMLLLLMSQTLQISVEFVLWTFVLINISLYIIDGIVEYHYAKQ